MASPPSETPAISLVDVFKAQTKLQALTNAAQNLNELSDRLTAQVAEIETTINKLNLGVRAVVDVETSSDDGLSTCVLRLGYGKVDGKWGFTIDQFLEPDPEDTYEKWAFKDAPRDLRLKVVERIPQLLDELTTTSIKLASVINEKITVTKQLAASFKLSSTAGSKK